MVRMIPITKLYQKLKPILIRKGRDMKRIKEGIAIQNILTEKFLILSISSVSKYSHIIDKTVTIGIDAKMAPKKLLLFVISETMTIIKEEMINFNK